MHSVCGKYYGRCHGATRWRVGFCTRVTSRVKSDGKVSWGLSPHQRPLTSYSTTLSHIIAFLVFPNILQRVFHPLEIVWCFLAPTQLQLGYLQDVFIELEVFLWSISTWWSWSVTIAIGWVGTKIYIQLFSFSSEYNSHQYINNRNKNLYPTISLLIGIILCWCEGSVTEPPAERLRILTNPTQPTNQPTNPPIDYMTIWHRG